MAIILEPTVRRGGAEGTSDRNFGLTFAGLFALIAGWPAVRGHEPRWWALAIGAGIAAAALTKPGILAPLNRAWLALGRMLHRIVTPVVMGIIFFGCVTPIAWLLRLRRKDVLSLTCRPDLQSYWVKTGAAAPATETMKNQF